MRMETTRDGKQRGREAVWRPILPGYLGLSTPRATMLNWTWPDIMSIEGVIGPLRIDGQPANVGPEVIRIMQSLEYMEFEPEEKKMNLNIGQTVKITTGAFENLEVKITGFGTNSVNISLGNINAKIDRSKIQVV